MSLASKDGRLSSSTIDIWLKTFLAKRKLTEPDGRPLFAYKATEQEYNDLIMLLRGLSDASRNISIPQAFLLYAAEWWRLQYEGGSWRWSPILEGINKSSISLSYRQQLVEQGCAAWKLKERIETGKKFIGLVAINGGLPLRLIEQAQGGLSQLLRAVLRTALLYKFSESEIYVEVDAAAKQYLPQSYQQQVVLKLLTQIVYQTVQLKQTLQKGDTEDLVEKLDKIRPNWQHQFPIALDSSSAKQLLNGLLQEAKSFVTSTASTQYPFEIIRQLRFSDQGVESLELSFEMLTKCKKEQFANALNIDVEQLYPTMQLLLRIKQKCIPVGEAFLTVDDVRLKKIRFDIPDNYAMSIAEIGIPGGDELDDELPWIFEDKFPTSNLIRVGSAKIKDLSAIVILPARAIIYNEHEPEPKELANNYFENKKIYRVPKDKTLIVFRSNRYSIECQAVDFDSGLLFWTAPRIDRSSKPEIIFKGFPTLRLRREDSSVETIPSHEIFQVINRKEQALDFKDPDHGKCQFIWKKDNLILSKTNAVLVPESAKISVLPAKNKPFEGRVTLTDWPCQKVICTDPLIGFEVDQNGQDWQLSVKADSAYHPRLLPLNILWSGGEQELVLPFPGTGAVAFDRDGLELRSKSWLSLQQLEGAYIRLMSHSNLSWQSRLQLFNRNAEAFGAVNLNYGTDQEIRLYELMDPIQHLLSSIYDLDAVVQIGVYEGQKPQLELNVGRYALKIIPSTQDTIAISIAQHKPNNDAQELASERCDHIILQAVQLQALEQEPIVLERHYSEGVWTGKWKLTQLLDIKGVWFIYPKNSNHDLRPLSKFNPKGQLPVGVGGSSIKAALNLTDFDKRIPALCDAIEQITANPAHPEWSYTKRFLERFSYLPFNSLDFWNALARLPKAMAVCFLFFDSFAEKATEKVSRDLPFEWVLVSPQDWIYALRFIQQDSQSKSAAELKLFMLELPQKRDLLNHHNPALSFVFNMASYTVFRDSDQNTKLFIKHPELLINMQMEQLFTQENSKLQALLRSAYTENEIWPMGMQDKCIAFYHQEPWLKALQISAMLPHKHQLQIIILPFMLAKSVTEQKGKEWLDNYTLLIELRKCREFNQEWFDAAYTAAIMYYSMDMIKND
jgi:hypothetical protein